MTTNAEKIAAWRQANPDTTMNASLLREILSLADLRYANLRDANLRNANLRDADLRVANLPGANLRYADLRNANLRNANLRVANLTGANLSNADLSNAILRGADLRNAILLGYLPLSTPSGAGWLIPTPDGWRITIGCWRDRTLNDLQDLIADRTEWPEATGDERERRRPILAAVLATAQAHTEYHAGIVPALAKKWSTK